MCLRFSNSLLPLKYTLSDITIQFLYPSIIVFGYKGWTKRYFKVLRHTLQACSHFWQWAKFRAIESTDTVRLQTCFQACTQASEWLNRSKNYHLNHIRQLCVKYRCLFLLIRISLLWTSLLFSKMVSVVFLKTWAAEIQQNPKIDIFGSLTHRLNEELELVVWSVSQATYLNR